METQPQQREIVNSEWFVCLFVYEMLLFLLFEIEITLSDSIRGRNEVGTGWTIRHSNEGKARGVELVAQ